MSTTRTRYLPSASRCFARWPPINPPPPQTTARSFAIGPHAPDTSIVRSAGLSILRSTLSSLRQAPTQDCTLLQAFSTPSGCTACVRAPKEQEQCLPLARLRGRKSREHPHLSQPVRDVFGGTIAEQQRQPPKRSRRVRHEPGR